MKSGNAVSTVPTIGFNIEKFQVENVEFNCWDIGGQDKIRVVWKKYVELSDGIIFVVDICDEDRWQDAANELARVVEHDDMKPVLILANKADDPHDPELPSRKQRLMDTFMAHEFANTIICHTVCAIETAKDSNPLSRLIPAFQWMINSL